MNRELHIGNAQLGNHGAVIKLYQGMDNALRMDHDFNLFIGHIEQPVSFHYLQTFIGQCRAVDGNLFPHAPVGMLQALRKRNLFQFVFCFSPERPAGRS